MRKGVTLTEVVVGSVIFAIAFGGLLSTFVAVRRYINKANQRLIASDLASQTLNNLYREVRQNSWDTGALRPGLTNLSSYTIDGQIYQDGTSLNSYTVTTIGDYRRVSVSINYPDD